MLHIQKYLHLYGIEKTVSDLKLVYREKDNLFLLKYDQINADWTNPATHECRGIILDKNTFEIVSYPYEKFWNLHEGYAAKLDYSTTKWYTKYDGSLICLYYYKNEWNIQTSGTIDADSECYHPTLKFKDLVWLTVEKVYSSKAEFISLLDTNNFYMFELCTPYNIVVTPHKDFNLYLHGVRSKIDLNYISLDSINGLVKAESHSINDIDEMNILIETMPWTSEGFVLVDADFNRVKCKNPSYVAVHHAATKSSPYSIMEIVIKNEITEFLAYFPHHADEIDILVNGWNSYKSILENYYSTIKDIETDKEFAITILNSEYKKYSSIFFNMRKGLNIHDSMVKFKDKRYWYNLIIHKNEI